MIIKCKCGKDMTVDDFHPKIYPTSRDYCEKCGLLIYERCTHGILVLNEIEKHKH